MKSWIAALPLAAILAASAHAAAREPNWDAARQHFESGRTRLRAGRCDLAIEEFRASIDAEPSFGAWINLGDCFEALGQLQEAYEAHRAAEALAAQKHDERLSVARESAERIEAKAVRLTVTAPPEPSDVTVSVDGKVVPRERWAAILVSPNDRHTIEARAPRTSTNFARQVFGRSGESIPIAVTFEKGVASGTEDGATDHRAGKTASPVRTGGFIGIGVGAAALVGGVIFSALASSARGDLADAIARNPRCKGAYPDEKCDPSVRGDLQPIQDRMYGQGTVATTLLIGGVVLVGAGLATVLFARPNETKTARSFSPGFVW